MWLSVLPLFSCTSSFHYQGWGLYIGQSLFTYSALYYMDTQMLSRYILHSKAFYTWMPAIMPLYLCTYIPISHYFLNTTNDMIYTIKFWDHRTLSLAFLLLHRLYRDAWISEGKRVSNMLCYAPCEIFLGSHMHNICRHLHIVVHTIKLGMILWGEKKDKGRGGEKGENGIPDRWKLKNARE